MPTAVDRAAGEMERLVRAFDWASTPLGPASLWPRSLHVLVDTILAHPFPAVLLWGPRLVQIYNDAYAVVAGGKHPAALGAPTLECWPEVAHVAAPIYERVLAGESVALHDVPFTLHRSGRPEEAFLTLGCSPVKDDEGAIAGVLATVFETTDRVRADRAHAAAERERVRIEAQRELALAAAKLGWWRFDVATGNVRVDERLSEIYGEPGPDWPYERVIEMIHPEDRATIDLAVKAAIDPRAPAPYFVEYRVQRRDGSVRWVQSRGLARFEGEGESRRVVSLSGTAADVTETKSSAAALRTSTERLSLALAAAKLGDWEWDAATDVMTMSERTGEIYGVPAGAWGRRTTLRDLLHPDDRAAAKEASDRAIAERSDYDVEYRVQRPDGREVWVAAKGRAIYDDAGRVTHMLGVVQDVTARKEQEAALQTLLAKVESERARLSDVFMRSPAFMCVLSGPRHVFEYVNEQYLRLIGDRDVLGKPIVEALPEIQGQGYFELLDKIYTTGERFVGTDMQVFLRRGGEVALEERFVDFVYQPMRGDDGSISGILVHGIDVTDAKRNGRERERLLERERAARTEAEQANRMKDDFLATLSHELRTPLNAIVGWSQLLRRGVETPGGLTDEMIAEGVATIERNALAQARIIEDLLDMSRIISGKIRLDVRRLQLAGPVRAGIETVRPAAQAKAIRVVEEIDPAAELVSGDPARLQQVFWNLLSNAVKFTPAGGNVRVTVALVGDHVEATVADDGVGISPEFLPHVFDRFRQADGSTTRRHGGLGLGLAIVRQLVELHGGTIRVHSEGERRGAAFTVSLPVAPAVEITTETSVAAAPADDERGESAAGAMLRGVTVLVVDDEPDGRAIVKRILEQSGATVETAPGARDALDRLRAASVDVLVSDVGMPDMDGCELVSRVRALPPDAGGATPALALTAYVRSEDRVRALRAGFNRYLVKPVDPLELLAMVAGLAGVTD